MITTCLAFSKFDSCELVMKTKRWSKTTILFQYLHCCLARKDYVEVRLGFRNLLHEASCANPMECVLNRTKAKSLICLRF